MTDLELNMRYFRMKVAKNIPATRIGIKYFSINSTEEMKNSVYNRHENFNFSVLRLEIST
jgi:hypothetical protein